MRVRRSFNLPLSARVHRMRTREIVFPLTADTEFLDTLTGALSNLSNLQHTQREQFLTNTESLCSAVARVASPYATKSDLYVWREIFSLWVEMQIFESERERDRGELSVDESERRLKHFADELAKRGWGADAPPSGSGGGGGRMARRKVSTGGSGMKDQASLEALDDFLRLNVALLDVKKFQRVNVEAARKILKKHDKRTALTASSDLRAFMAEQEAARARAGAAGGNWIAPIELPSASDMYLLGGRRPSALTTSSSVGSVGGSNLGSIAHPSLAALLPSSTTGMLSESLPHILLSLLTTTLLPILPSIDDYSCAICTSVAWRPIRLDCRHLFCIRCLVKLQKKGRSDCPLCRMPGVVSSADQSECPPPPSSSIHPPYPLLTNLSLPRSRHRPGNMDDATLNMLKTWFPTEVKEKDRENEAERQKEEMEELGIGEDGKCVVC